MSKRRRYKSPPIEEAVCEFRFKPDRDWDFTIPGKLQTKFGDEYTGKPREQKVVEVGLETQEGKPSNLRYGEGLARVQLVTKSEKRMIGVGPDLLSIHMLRPYQDPSHPKRSGWDEFESRISEALDAYWSVAQPVGVNRIGIRYINKIIVPGKTVRVEEYLRCALPDLNELPDRLNSFVGRMDYAYPDGVRLILSQGSVGAPSDHIGFLLDLDVIWETAEPVKRDATLKTVADLRARERSAFETVITDKTRDLFDEN